MKNIETEIINTTKQIGDLVDWLILCALPQPYKPTIYIDLEGVDLCRDGSLSIFTLLIDTGIPTIRVCLIDVHSLGLQAFNTTGIKQRTLKDILQDEKIPKVFFDVRNDSDALFAHFGVALQGVEDIQLMESATRTTTRSREYLNSLAKCVEQYVLYDIDRANWKLVKAKGERLFKAEHGGSYEIFNRRPIPDEIVSYCVGDVQYLPLLWDKFRQNTNRWRDLVNEETKKRVAASQEPEYQPHGPDRALAPWSIDQNRKLDEWNYVRSPKYFDEDGGWEEEDEWDDHGPISCRDIINDYFERLMAPSVCHSAPDSAFHTLIVKSLDANARVVPFDEKATALTKAHIPIHVLSLASLYNNNTNMGPLFTSYIPPLRNGNYLAGKLDASF